jgi:outer membrane receptor for monomeric catechols
MSVAQPANPTLLPADDETVVLSPFTVNTSKDVGYLAGNTLAGSRLNTSLKDTGAAISVLTPEFLKDIGATNMKDVILFQNNAVPDFGDAANSVNGNPLIGNNEWQLRIRGLSASYARNYFKWEVSSDFYNVDRIDQARGPNSILFGFGAPGGIVNTTTKQANVNKAANEVGFTFGSWNRYRGTADTNLVLIPGELALRVNLMAENGNTWREFEFDRSRRGDIALTFKPTKTSTIRAEVEVGKVNDNVARPWLAIDESFLWRAAGRPTYTGAWPSYGVGVATFYPDHLVVGDDGVVRNWLGHALGSNGDKNVSGSAATGWNAPTWSQLDPKYHNIVPINSNLGGPDAVRETKYNTISAFYENQITDRLSIELALNHQKSDFFGYDSDGSRATTYYGSTSEIWGDASADLPSGATNPNAGKLYLENNWTRRTEHLKSTEFRGTAAYNFDTGTWGRHRAAGLLDYNNRDSSRKEESEVFLNNPLDSTNPTADVNRVYRRHYFQEGNAADIHVASWRTPVAGAGWAVDQTPENAKQKQTTGMLALQSFFLNDKLVSIFGLRGDSMRYDYDGVTTNWWSQPIPRLSHKFNANTFTAGVVYHVTKPFSLYGNFASSRDIPDIRIHLIDAAIPPMPDSKGGDVGIKLDLLDGKVYVTAGYYKTQSKHVTDWGDIQTSVTDLNTRVLKALYGAGLITAAEQTAHTINANGYLQDRDSSGWEFSVVANPTLNWRISANFSINHVVAHNSMAEVKAWADANTAFWLAKAAPKGGANFVINTDPTATWDTLGAQNGWLYQYHIDPVVALDGHETRGQREYGGNLYTKYTFSSGPLKNFSIGGGGRYQSQNVLGFYNGEVRYGTSLVLADASLGYTFKTEFIGKGSWAELQLNVANLFDNRRSQIYTLAWWDPTSSIPERIGLQEPRKYTLSATLHF